MRRPSARAWRIAAGLFVATIGSTHWVGAENVLGHPPSSLAEWLMGARFAVPLLAILVAHESGHFFAAMRRGVRASPPMFLPVPFALLGTMGAVIGLSRVRRRDAMLEIGAAGPLAGLVVALPVLAFGLMRSSISAPPTTPYLLEGHSLLYLAFVRVFAGAIPDGQDVMLAPEAFAGWAGLLVTMANLVPIGQLDGGHVMRAWLGPSVHARFERPIHLALAFVSLCACVTLGANAFMETGNLAKVLPAASGGLGWGVWAAMIALLSRFSAVEPPDALARPRSRRDARRLRRTRRLSHAGAVYAARKRRSRTCPDGLGRWQRRAAILTLLFFPLLFMPFWIRVIEP